MGPPPGHPPVRRPYSDRVTGNRRRGLRGRRCGGDPGAGRHPARRGGAAPARPGARARRRRRVRDGHRRHQHRGGPGRAARLARHPAPHRVLVGGAGPGDRRRARCSRTPGSATSDVVELAAPLVQLGPRRPRPELWRVSRGSGARCTSPTCADVLDSGRPRRPRGRGTSCCSTSTTAPTSSCTPPTHRCTSRAGLAAARSALASRRGARRVVLARGALPAHGPARGRPATATR